MKNLAPNGKQSNLTPEQYKLVRTPAFKKWFGDWENDTENASKVVDENGEPLVVYHGTNAEFYVFEKSKRGSNTDNGIFGKGFYLSKNLKTAQSYGAKIIDVYINIINPFRVNDFKSKSEMAKNLGIDERLLREGGTGISALQPFTGIFSDAIKENGHDGVITKFGEYVVFEPNQIKLADGTNTTFDGSNPDIRFSDGGNVNEIAYHISDKDFDFFDKNKIGTNDLHLKRKKDEVGFFFTKSEWDINSMISVNFRYKRNPIVYVCELNYNNPYTFEDLEKSDFYGYVNKNMGGWNIYDRFTNEIISDAKRLNKDAIYLDDFIVVFEPTQINILKKEKIKKGQIYQLNNTDIRYANGGEINNEFIYTIGGL